MIDLSRVWPEWKAVEQIGEGSFGKVYKCVRNEYGITEYGAVKVITIPQNEAEVSNLRFEGMSEKEARTYFEGIVNDFANEIKVMVMLRNAPNIVPVENYAIVEHENSIGWNIYIRMDYLTSFVKYSLERRLDEGGIKKFGLDMCNALEVCAQKGIIHRDIKPDNIFVDEYGSYRLGDFGVARKLENTVGAMSKKGTYSYMAPEVFKGKKYDNRADIYSLGMVMYKLINNNRDPFVDPAKSFVTYNDKNTAIERRFGGEKLPAPAQASPAMAAVILKACEYRPEDRFASVDEFKAALEAVPAFAEEPTVAARDYFEKTVAARDFELPKPVPAQADYNDETVVAAPVAEEATEIMGEEPTVMSEDEPTVFDDDATVMATPDPDATMIADEEYDETTVMAENGDIPTDKDGKKKKKIIIFSILSALAVAIVLAFVFRGNVANFIRTGSFKPELNASVTDSSNEDANSHYTTAKELIDSGNYAEAYSHLVQCIDYEDSYDLLRNFRFAKEEIYYGDDYVLSLYEYDENGNILTKINDTWLAMGYRYEYEYDENNNIIKSVEYNRDGSVVSESLIEYEYDKYGNIISETYFDEDGNVTSMYEYEYDEFNNETLEIQYLDNELIYQNKYKYSYDDEGNVVNVEQTYENGDLVYINTYENEYDKYGNLIQQLCYDEYGNLESKAVYEYKFYDDSFCFKWIYYDNEGNVAYQDSSTSTEPVSYKVSDNSKMS